MKQFFLKNLKILFPLVYGLIMLLIKVLSYTSLSDCPPSGFLTICLSPINIMLLLVNLSGLAVTEIFIMLSPKGYDTFYPLFLENIEVIYSVVTVVLLFILGAYLDKRRAGKKRY